MNWDRHVGRRTKEKGKNNKDSILCGLVGEKGLTISLVVRTRRRRHTEVNYISFPQREMSSNRKSSQSLTDALPPSIYAEMRTTLLPVYHTVLLLSGRFFWPCNFHLSHCSTRLKEK